jgi:hypothetical protein
MNSKDSSTTITVGTHWIPLDDPYQPKADQLAKDLDVVGSARRNAVGNLPATTDSDLDDAQRKIVAAGDRGTATLLALGESNIRLACNEIDTIMPRPVAASLEEADIHRAIAEEKRNSEDSLDQRHQARQSAWRHRELFKADNSLTTRPAVYKDDIVVFVLTLLMLGIAEAAANSWILQDAGDGGVTGGFLIAIAVGAVNILLGLTSGVIGLRWINHIDPKKRVDGWIVVLVVWILALAMHIVLAHYREALEHAQSESVAIDFGIVLRPWAWFAFTGLQPFLLLVFGVICFLVAAVKGRGGTWGIADIYPHYATVDREFRRADRELNEGVEKFKRDIRRAYDQQRDNLRGRHAADQRNVEQIRLIATKASRLVRDVQESNQAWLQVTGQLLRRYRETNTQIRTTPQPNYFRAYPTLEDLRARLVEDTDVRERLAHAESILAENARILASLEEKLTREHTEEVTNFLKHVAASEVRAQRRVVRDEVAPDVDFSHIDQEAGHVS